MSQPVTPPVFQAPPAAPATGTTPPVPAPPAPTPPPPPAPPAPATDDQGFPANTPLVEMTDAQRAAYWKHQSRKHEDEAKARRDYDEQKALADKYRAFEADSLTEQEKATREAAELRDQLTATRTQLVDAQLAALSAGRMTDAQRATLLDGLDRTRFLKTDGTVDVDKLRGWVDGIAPPATGTPATPGTPAAPSLGQGARQGTPSPSVADGAALYRSIFPAPAEPAAATQT